MATANQATDLIWTPGARVCLDLHATSKNVLRMLGLWVNKTKLATKSDPKREAGSVDVFPKTRQYQENLRLENAKVKKLRSCA